MCPILIRIGSVSIFSYGFMLLLAVIAVFVVARMELRRKGFKPNLSFELILYLIISGIIGARLFYAVLNWNQFSQNPARIFSLGEGGFGFFGGFLAWALVLLVFSKVRNLPFTTLLDILAPGLALGEAIARIGCFLNGCCYGYPTKFFLGVSFPLDYAGPRHPTQLYQSFADVLIFLVVWFARKRTKASGNLFWLYVLLYSPTRFAVEFFRDETQRVGGFTYAQFIAAASFLAAMLILILKKKRSTHEKSVCQASE